MRKSVDEKGFLFLDWNDFFEFFRRTVSLLSSSVMIVFLSSFMLFFIQDKLGNDSIPYYIIIILIGFIYPVVFLLFCLI
ncbi:hypothetical protein [Xenorhabdus ishibashii]|uniref:Uncharacterized protein n=1 Tax=Xenorhabdus ishibashii TaxID=1034471 RepID=A0A2D0K7Y3_9GAMM|nr:hypothetical protein [Xenorhabdus ishibashii]PHM59492.1 hypothetical protein Xish_03610 [Xenorhabdus ishibashii]